MTDSRYSYHFTVIYLPILEVYTKYQRYIIEGTYTRACPDKVLTKQMAPIMKVDNESALHNER